jgi:hypothetical protein
MDLVANGYYNGTNWIAKTTAASSRYVQTSGAHTWKTAASVTAGSTLSYSDLMTLTAAGSLGIGTTSPARLLDVAGTTRIADGSAIEWGGTSAAIAGSSSSNVLFFYTASTERARITSGGYFKASNAGTYQNSTGSFHELRSSTTSNLIADLRHTDSSNPFGMIIGFTAATPNGTSNYFLNCIDSTAQRAEIRSNGGIANYSANDANLSDRREKTNFAPATSYLDKICAIPVQTFNYIDQNLEEDAGLTLGVVAQDVQAVAPELVMESNWAGKDQEPKMRLSIYQTDLQYALMKCIQEQQALIVSLKARLDAANL